MSRVTCLKTDVSYYSLLLQDACCYIVSPWKTRASLLRHVVQQEIKMSLFDMSYNQRVLIMHLIPRRVSLYIVSLQDMSVLRHVV